MAISRLLELLDVVVEGTGSGVDGRSIVGIVASGGVDELLGGELAVGELADSSPQAAAIRGSTTGRQHHTLKKAVRRRVIMPTTLTRR